MRGRLADAGGETITMPFWNTDITGITQDAIRDSRTGVTPSKISLDSYQETAIAKTISIDGDQYAFNDASESYLAHISLIVANEFARVTQEMLLTRAATTDLSLDITGEAETGLNVDAILKARLLWNDAAGEMSPVLFAHTAQFSYLARTAEYKTLATSTGGIVKAEGDWSRFVVGNVHGIPVVLCDALPSSTAMLIGGGALGLYVADNPVSKKVDHAGSAVVTLDTHFRYAATLWKHNPRRVVKLITAE
jgi:hypothetical protein